jgi:hypothetical protein
VYGDPAPGTSPPAQTQNTHIRTCTHTRAKSFPRIRSYCARFFLCVRAFLPADTVYLLHVCLKDITMTMKANESPSITVAQSAYSCSNVSAYHFFLSCRCLSLSTCHPYYHQKRTVHSWTGSTDMQSKEWAPACKSATARVKVEILPGGAGTLLQRVPSAAESLHHWHRHTKPCSKCVTHARIFFSPSRTLSLSFFPEKREKQIGGMGGA